MYRDDMPRIREYAHSSPDNLVQVGTFVLATIQMPFYRMLNAMEDIKQKGANSSYLFGSKRLGYAFMSENKERLHSEMLAIFESGDNVECKLIELFVQIPGLGIPKAAFLAQLVGAETACLDTHNLAHFGIDEKAFRLGAKVTAKTIRAKIARYVETCRAYNTSEGWWNSWCEFVVNTSRNAGKFANAEEVSKLHCLALGLS